jgi:hypothetical protein
VHAPEPNLTVEHMDGDEFFRWLKEQVTARRRQAIVPPAVKSIAGVTEERLMLSQHC